MLPWDNQEEQLRSRYVNGPRGVDENTHCQPQTQIQPALLLGATPGEVKMQGSGELCQEAACGSGPPSAREEHEQRSLLSSTTCFAC